MQEVIIPIAEDHKCLLIPFLTNSYVCMSIYVVYVPRNLLIDTMAVNLQIGADCVAPTCAMLGLLSRGGYQCLLNLHTGAVVVVL